MDVMPDYISAKERSVDSTWGHDSGWGSARALLDASATLFLVEVRGSGRSSKTVREFSGSYEQARACGQCSAAFPMFESFGVLSRQNIVTLSHWLV